MAKIPGLVRRKRSDVFYYRKRIPTDIRRLIDNDFATWKALALNPGSRLSAWVKIAPGKNKRPEFYEQSLNTKDPAQARIAFHDLAARLEDTYQIIRAAYTGEKRQASDAELRRLAYVHFLTLDEASDRAGTAVELTGEDLDNAILNAKQDFGALDTEDPSYVASLRLRRRHF